MLTVIDEFTKESLAIVMVRRLRSDDVLHCLAELFAAHGPPDHTRSDNGSEFTAEVVRNWLARIGVKTLFIEPGSPGENGYNESFNGKLRDELLNGQIFYTLQEAKVLIERCDGTTTRSGPTVRWAIGHQHRQPGRREGPIRPSLHRGCGRIGPSRPAEV